MKLSKKLAARQVHKLQDIMDTCYEAAGVIVSSRYDEGFPSSWSGGGIQKLDHYLTRLEALLKNLSRSKARTIIARELFTAVIRGDLTIEDIEEGSADNGRTG